MRSRLKLTWLILLILAACSTPQTSATNSSADVGTFQEAPCPIDLPEDVEEDGEIVFGHVPQKNAADPGVFHAITADCNSRAR